MFKKMMFSMGIILCTMCSLLFFVSATPSICDESEDSSVSDDVYMSDDEFSEARVIITKKMYTDESPKK